MSGATTAVIIAVKRRQIIKEFKRLGATSEYHAITPEEHGIRRSLIFNGLKNSKVLVETADGRFYLNEVREKEVVAQRRRLAFILIIILAGFLAFLLLTNIFRQ